MSKKVAQIIVETPVQGTQVSAPFPVKIHFVPATGAKITAGISRRMNTPATA